MKRQVVPTLLEVLLVLEWVLLAPCVVLALLVVIAAAMINVSVFLGSLGIFLGLSGLCGLNYACFRGHGWALWLRAGISFLAASACARYGATEPGFYVFALERILQAGLCLHVLYRWE